MTYYQVAGLFFSFGKKLNLLAQEINYTPFQINQAEVNDNYLFHLDIDLNLNIRNKDCSFSYTNEIGYYGVACNNHKFEWTLKRLGTDELYVMNLDIQSKKAFINFNLDDYFKLQAANDFVRFAFIYTAAYHHTILLHSSCIKNNEKGIAFMGKSGIGKSTHSSLWLKHIENCELLNDDQPAVRVKDNSVIICGTPWSGKTNCYKNKSVKLYAILCMEQQPFNKLTPINNITLLIHLLSACSLIKSEKNTLKMIMQTLSRIAELVNAAILQNKPEEEAVSLAYDFLCKQN